MKFKIKMSNIRTPITIFTIVVLCDFKVYQDSIKIITGLITQVKNPVNPFTAKIR